jgi:hypothetical protein
MKIINNIAETKPTRMIVTCTKDEAFRLGNEWYTKIEMNDFSIRSSSSKYTSEFIEQHTHFSDERASFVALMPCIHLSSMSFIYLNSERSADEWATLTATLTTP